MTATPRGSDAKGNLLAAFNRDARSNPMKTPSICFVGIRNLPALAPEFGHLGTGGAELQQCLLAKALAARGLKVSMVSRITDSRMGPCGAVSRRIAHTRRRRAFP